VEHAWSCRFECAVSKINSSDALNCKCMDMGEKRFSLYIPILNRLFARQMYERVLANRGVITQNVVKRL